MSCQAASPTLCRRVEPVGGSSEAFVPNTSTVEFGYARTSIARSGAEFPGHHFVDVNFTQSLCHGNAYVTANTVLPMSGALSGRNCTTECTLFVAMGYTLKCSHRIHNTQHRRCVHGCIVPEQVRVVNCHTSQDSTAIDPKPPTMESEPEESRDQAVAPWAARSESSGYPQGVGTTEAMYEVREVTFPERSTLEGVSTLLFEFIVRQLAHATKLCYMTAPCERVHVQEVCHTL